MHQSNLVRLKLLFKNKVMKKIIISTLLVLFNLVAYAQTSTTSPKEFASLQTNELVNHYNLSDDLKAKIFEINFLCANKIEALLADKQMAKDAIDEGVLYNKELRDKSVRNLLNEKQLDSYYEFCKKSTYNLPIK